MQMRWVIVAVLIGGTWPAIPGSTADAAPCLIVTLTGTQGGPSSFNGLAGAGTLVRYGDDSNDCGTVKLQFDAGRGTTMRLSQLRVGPEQLNAVFFTHMHNDHTEGFADLVQLRWSFHGRGPKIDTVCSSDAVTSRGFTVSCRNFVTHIADAFIQSGEIAQRHSELESRTAGGPAELINTITFEPKDEPQVVWSSGDVTVSAVRSTHIAGHASYRVDTPAGSVVIGGDAGNDVLAPPRQSSTSGSSREAGERGRHPGAFGHSSNHGTGQGERDVRVCILPPEHGTGSRRHGEACGGKISHAHPSNSAARSGRTISVQGSRRASDCGGLQESRRRQRVHRRDYCGNRSRQPPVAAQVRATYRDRYSEWPHGSSARSSE